MSAQRERRLRWLKIAVPSRSERVKGEGRASEGDGVGKASQVGREVVIRANV